MGLFLRETSSPLLQLPDELYSEHTADPYRVRGLLRPDADSIEKNRWIYAQLSSERKTRISETTSVDAT